MSCFSCFSSNHRRPSKRFGSRRQYERAPADARSPRAASNRSTDANYESVHKAAEDIKVGNGNIEAQTFTFRALATATKNFRSECLVGEGGFGRVYRGQLETGQVVAVKQLDRSGFQGNSEFLVEVLTLSLLHHHHLVNLIGYCADGEQRLLVYEFMPRGSLEDHLLDVPRDQTPLSWSVRMRIAFGTAEGLEYLHDKANPPVIYRDLKSSNILLDDEFTPKLSDFGLAKLGPIGGTVHVSSRVMGTYGYCAPEYARTGQLSLKSDVYSFGVVLLELITGRRVIDAMRPAEEQNLVTWAEPMFKDQKRYSELADPLLRGDYPARGLSQAIAVAAMCLHEDASVRPMMTDVVTALSFLVTPAAQEAQPTALPQREGQPSDHGVLDNEVVEDRQREVQEAIEWGVSSSKNQLFRRELSLN